MAQPPVKKARTEAGDVVMQAEEIQELETDAADLKGKRISSPVTFYVPDTTVNLLPSVEHNILAPLTDGGFTHLAAGARANVGMMSGRYCFEVKIVEHINRYEPRSGDTGPRQSIKLGFSTARSCLFLGETEDSVCFTGDGTFLHNKQQAGGGTQFMRSSVLTLILNLERGHPNCNTVSLFKDGVRAASPVPLPESLHGKTLFPAITFKNMVVHVNFGPSLLMPLPFKCHMLGQAVEKDVEVTGAPDPKVKGQVVYPWGLPDTGMFDWADGFLEQNPSFTEISDRVILDWAEKSGVHRPKGYSFWSRSSMDQPDLNFGIPSLDDMSVRRLFQAVAPLQRRNLLIMEVKGNLIASERRESLKSFSSSDFNKVSMVMIGDPTPDFKKREQMLALKAKQEKSDKEFHDRKLAEKKKKEVERKKKEAERFRRRAEKARKKAEEEKKKQAEAEAKAAEEAKAKETALEKAEEKAEAKTEAKTEENQEAEEKAEDKVEEKADEKPAEDAEKAEEPKEEEKDSEEEEEEKEEEDNEKPPVVELDDEETKLVFRKMPIPDLKEFVMNTSFTNFSLPAKDDGFDEIKLEWNKTPKQCEQALKAWVVDKKMITRIEDIVPSQTFNERNASWQKTLSTWKAKQTDYNTKVAKSTSARAAKAAAKLKQPAEKNAPDKAEDADAEEKKDKETKDAAPMDVDEPKEDEEDEYESAEAKVNWPDLDVFGVEDVVDVGGIGMPLFKDFRAEDWAMSNLRVELYLLVNAFKKDANDPDRTGIHLDHVTFYYGKYFKKHLQPRHYGMEDVARLLSLVRDTIHVSPNKIMESLLPEDMESFSVFAKCAEEDRRHRNIRLDLGEEDAKLKINLYTDSDNQQRRGNWNQDGWSRGGYRGSGGGSGGGNWQQTGPKGAGKVWGTGPGNWNNSGSWDKPSDIAGGYGNYVNYGKGGNYGQLRSYGQDNGYGRQAYGQIWPW